MRAHGSAPAGLPFPTDLERNTKGYRNQPLCRRRLLHTSRRRPVGFVQGLAQSADPARLGPGGMILGSCPQSGPGPLIMDHRAMGERWAVTYLQAVSFHAAVLDVGSRPAPFTRQPVSLLSGDPYRSVGQQTPRTLLIPGKEAEAEAYPTGDQAALSKHGRIALSRRARRCDGKQRIKATPHCVFFLSHC